VLYLIPKVWAKRTNIVVAAITVAFAIKCYILYTGCYRGICPDKRIGIFLILLAAGISMLASLLPDLPVKREP
jgi:hypothetical protein